MEAVRYIKDLGWDVVERYLSKNIYDIGPDKNVYNDDLRICVKAREWVCTHGGLHGAMESANTARLQSYVALIALIRIDREIENIVIDRIYQRGFTSMKNELHVIGVEGSVRSDYTLMLDIYIKSIELINLYEKNKLSVVVPKLPYVISKTLVDKVRDRAFFNKGFTK